jgi:hypothetical protein
VISLISNLVRGRSQHQKRAIHESWYLFKSILFNLSSVEHAKDESAATGDSGVAPRRKDSAHCRALGVGIALAAKRANQ